MVDGVANGSDVGAGLMSPRQQLMRMLRRTPRTVRIADTVSATLLAQVLAQQLAAARIEQSHVHRVPLHMDLAPDPARRRSVVSCFNLYASIQVNRAFAVLVEAKRLQRQRLQMGLLFSEHSCHLPLGPAMDALIGPAFFPVVQIRLRFFQALETLALQWRLLRMADAGFDLALAIRVPHLARQCR